MTTKNGMPRRDVLRMGALGATAAWAATLAKLGLAARQGADRRAALLGPEGLRRDLPGTLKAIKGFGYEAVEFAGYYGRSAADMRKLLDDNGLKCCRHPPRPRHAEVERLATPVVQLKAIARTRFRSDVDPANACTPDPAAERWRAHAPGTRSAHDIDEDMSIAGLRPADRRPAGQRRARPAALAATMRTWTATCRVRAAAPATTPSGRSYRRPCSSKARPSSSRSPTPANCIDGGDDPVALIKAYPGRTLDDPPQGQTSKTKPDAFSAARRAVESRLRAATNRPPGPSRLRPRVPTLAESQTAIPSRPAAVSRLPATRWYCSSAWASLGAREALAQFDESYRPSRPARRRHGRGRRALAAAAPSTFEGPPRAAQGLSAVLERLGHTSRLAAVLGPACSRGRSGRRRRCSRCRSSDSSSGWNAPGRVESRERRGARPDPRPRERRGLASSSTGLASTMPSPPASDPRTSCGALPCPVPASGSRRSRASGASTGRIASPGLTVEWLCRRRAAPDATRPGTLCWRRSILRILPPGLGEA